MVDFGRAAELRADPSGPTPRDGIEVVVAVALDLQGAFLGTIPTSNRCDTEQQTY